MAQASGDFRCSTRTVGETPTQVDTADVSKDMLT